MEPSTISSVEQVVGWDRKNPDIHIFVKDLDANRVVGEITLLPLTKDQFNKFIRYELEDTEINEDTLTCYEEGREYYLLFSAIAIDPEYRNNKIVLSKLLHGFYDKLKNIMEKDISFLNMCAEGQTKDGQKFVEGFLDLKEKYTTPEGYILYSFDTKEEFTNWFKIFPSYIQNYDKTII